MAFEIKGQIVTFETGTTFSSTQLYRVVAHATSAARTVLFPSSVGAMPLGITQDYTSGGGITSVMLDGISKLEHDGTATVGAGVGFTTAGLGTAYSTGVAAWSIGLCLEAPSTASGSFITVQIDKIRQSS